jgi:hypothetical protein
MQLKIEEDDFVERLFFSNEATFHISGKVNRQCPYLGNRASTCTDRVNVFCAVSREKARGPFFFTEATVTGDSFLDMMVNWLLPQLNTSYDDYILQLDGAPSPCSHECTSASQSCSSTALQAITVDMLHRAWDEFDYRVDVCRVTQGVDAEGV